MIWCAVIGPMPLHAIPLPRRQSRQSSFLITKAVAFAFDDPGAHLHHSKFGCGNLESLNVSFEDEMEGWSQVTSDVLNGRGDAGRRRGERGLCSTAVRRRRHAGTLSSSQTSKAYEVEA